MFDIILIFLLLPIVRILRMSEIVIDIPFKVSARTARLIGRENIATSKGAIIELVKNGFDSDSSVSIVYFDNKYSSVQSEITSHFYNQLIGKGIPSELLNAVYQASQDGYMIKEKVPDEIRSRLKQQVRSLAALYIIDAGEGMTQKIIRDHWMTIGTDNKAVDVFTKSGRVKAGAKGIGRFALDKLGSKCTMTTIFNPNNHNPDTDVDNNPTSFSGYQWMVNWEDFEGEFKTIDTVRAKLVGLSDTSLLDQINKQIEEFTLPDIDESFQYGTILKITDLRDDWEDFYVSQVYNDLEVLVPPKETGEFTIYLYSSLTPKKYGEVLGSICDDYDYKLTAVADENQVVKITINRLEYDVDLIPTDFFNRPAMLEHPFTKEDFVNRTWTTTRTFSTLLPGFAISDLDNVFADIGVFDFSFYFMKRAYNTPDANRFFYRRFAANARQDWLDKFGGIKLFRDNFRVRPYGEIKDVAFDWLGLGMRKTASPNGVAKREGGYRVEPENVAGAIKISRLTNVNFEDRSSREGLQENKTFQIFKALIAAIINVFETDRSTIAREMDAFDSERFSEIRSLEEAEKLVKTVLKNSRIRKAERMSSGKIEDDEPNDLKDTQLAIIAELNERKDEEIEKLKEEQKVLRGLASSGIVLASFSHDLSKLNNVLDSRVEKLKDLFVQRIAETEYINVENRKNPYFQLEKMRKQDIKLQNWLNFSLGAARKDKRKRRQLFIRKYFADFKIDWSTVLENRGIDLDISNVIDVDLRVYEIDFDSIFNNLLVNSIDAFNSSTVDRPRRVIISAITNSKELIIDYSDSGPGLSSDIEKPQLIFEPLYTTKRNSFTGEEEGTGLGMWLIKSIVEENDGITKLLFPKEGFGLRIIFPVKFIRGKDV